MQLEHEYKMWIPYEEPSLVMEEGESEPDPYMLTVVKIIERAISDLDDCAMTEVYEQREAYWWLFLDTRDETQPFSLAWCCDHVGVKVSTVRATAERKFPRKCAAMKYSRWAQRQVVSCG